MTLLTNHPFQLVEVSGLYQVIHCNDHASEGEAIFVRLGFFPTCPECGEKVLYRLVKPVRHISEDRDFCNIVASVAPKAA